MSKYAGIHLSELGRSALRLCSECQYFYIIRRQVCTSRASRNRSGQENPEANRNNKQGNEETGRSSSFHQTYHRRSYERKRTDYEKGRDHGQGKSARTISFMANPSTTHYQRLNIDSSAGIDSIKSAYYSLSKQYHPDIVGKDNPDAVENFRLITDAYDTLSNPKTKAEYDQQIQLDTETALDPAYSSWKPQDYDEQNQETIYRMREAQRIFQSKQDEALAREKERNPNKFRSGVFRQDIDEVDINFERLENQIRYMDMSSNTRVSSNVFQRSDSNDFYRAHLYGTLLRRREELREHTQDPGSGPSDDFVWISLATLVGTLVFVALTAANAIYDFDIAALLDRRLQQKATKDIEVKPEH